MRFSKKKGWKKGLPAPGFRNPDCRKGMLAMAFMAHRAQSGFS
ncbi:hypothetical protein [Rhodoferax ferrireducens]|nr:hypothetical protein [Rhodoferax ferrireducens]